MIASQRTPIKYSFNMKSRNSVWSRRNVHPRNIVVIWKVEIQYDRVATYTHYMHTVYTVCILYIQYAYCIYSMHIMGVRCDAIILNFDFSYHNYISWVYVATRSYWISTFHIKTIFNGCTLRRDHTEFRLFRLKLYLMDVRCDAIILNFDFSY